MLHVRVKVEPSARPSGGEHDVRRTTSYDKRCEASGRVDILLTVLEAAALRPEGTR